MEVGGSSTQRLMSERTMTQVPKADALPKAHVETNVEEVLIMRCKRLQKYCDKNGIVVRLSVSWVNVRIWWTYIEEDIREIRNSYVLHQNYQIQQKNTRNNEIRHRKQTGHQFTIQSGSLINKWCIAGAEGS